MKSEVHYEVHDHYGPFATITAVDNLLRPVPSRCDPPPAKSPAVPWPCSPEGSATGGSASPDGGMVRWVDGELFGDGFTMMDLTWI